MRLIELCIVGWCCFEFFVYFGLWLRRLVFWISEYFVCDYSVILYYIVVFLENIFRNFYYDVFKNIDYKVDVNCCCLVDVV